MSLIKLIKKRNVEEVKLFLEGKSHDVITLPDEHGNIPLFYVIFIGNIELFKLFMDKIPEEFLMNYITIRDARGDSILGSSVRSVLSSKITKEIVNRFPKEEIGKQIVQRNENGLTPLRLSVLNNEEELFFLFVGCLSKEIFYEQLCEKEEDKHLLTLFVISISYSSFNVVKFILDSLPEEEAVRQLTNKNYLFSSPFFDAIKRGDDKIIELLLYFLPELRNELMLKYEDGSTQLHRYIKWKEAKVVESILKYLPKDKIESEILDCNEDGNNALKFSAYHGGNEVFKVFTDFISPEKIVSELTRKNERGETTLGFKINSTNEKTFLFIAEHVSRHDIITMISHKNKKGETILDDAVEEGYSDMIKKIFNYLSNEEIEECASKLKTRVYSTGQVAFSHFVRIKKLDMIRLFLPFFSQQEIEDQITHKNFKEETTFSYSVIYNNIEAVKLFLDYLPYDKIIEQLNYLDKENKSLDNHKHFLLREFSSLFNSFSDDLRPTLHWPVKKGRNEMIKALLSRLSKDDVIAQITAKDSIYNESCIDIAKKETLELIKSYIQ